MPEDFDGIRPMAEKFYNSTSFHESMPFHLPTIVEFYIAMLSSGFVLVAEHDGKLVGMLGALIHPFHLNAMYKVCTEAMWWVEPEHRRTGVAQDLEVEMRRLSKEAGCRVDIVSALDTSPPSVDAYYRSQGYRPAETAYYREV